MTIKFKKLLFLVLLLFPVVGLAQDVDAEIYIEQGIEAYEIEEYIEALDAFDEAAEADPNNADAYFHRGVVKAKIKQYKEAKDFKQAIKLTNEKSFYSKKKSKLKQYFCKI